MNCLNCGTLNNDGSKFCIKCGQSLSNQESVEQSLQQTNQPINYQQVQSQTMNNNSIQNENNFQPFATSTQTINTSVNSNLPVNKVSFTGYFFIILAVILKPFTAFKEELYKFDDFKNSAVLSLIISGIATLINLITSMLNVVMVKSYDWSSGGYKTTWTFENLKELNYLEVIGKNFLIYLAVIVAIATVYYIASLIVKKQTSFSRLLGISALAFAPMLICSLILSPLLSLIWAELGMLITFVGGVYTVVLLYESMNSEILLEGNAKYYFNLICLSLLGIAAYYLYIKLFISSISGGLEDMLFG